jgi:hypothetical protein
VSLELRIGALDSRSWGHNQDRVSGLQIVSLNFRSRRWTSDRVPGLQIASWSSDRVLEVSIASLRLRSRICYLERAIRLLQVMLLDLKLWPGVNPSFSREILSSNPWLTWSAVTPATASSNFRPRRLPRRPLP